LLRDDVLNDRVVADFVMPAWMRGEADDHNEWRRKWQRAVRLVHNKRAIGERAHLSTRMKMRSNREISAWLIFRFSLIVRPLL